VATTNSAIVRATVAALAVAQAVVPVLPRVVRRAATEQERSGPVQGPLTPAPGTFAIWGPLFATGIAYPLVAARATDRRTDPAGDVLVGAAFALDIAWSVNSQFRRLGWLSLGLIAGAATAAGVAVDRAERRDPAGGPDRARAALVGPLAGWLAVAAVANLETAANLRLGRPDGASEDRRAVGLLAAASALIGWASLRNRGNLPYAAASGWGLGGILVRALRERRPRVARAAAVGLTTVAAAAATGRRARRS
jgi:hypothetical protein